jgi:hypothetical protein
MPEEAWRSGAKAPCILISALEGGEWLTPHQGCFTSGKDPLVPTGHEAGWIQSQSGHDSEKQKLCPCWEMNRDSPLVQPTSTEPCWRILYDTD